MQAVTRPVVPFEDLNSLAGTGAKISELLIPSGVTAVDNAAINKSLSFSGDVLNYGTIDAVSSNRASCRCASSAKLPGYRQ